MDIAKKEKSMEEQARLEGGGRIIDWLICARAGKLAAGCLVSGRGVGGWESGFQGGGYLRC